VPTRPTTLRRRTVAPFVAPFVAALAVVGTGCTPFGASESVDDGPAPAEQPAATVTIPPIRLTPFCQAMIDLAERLESDPPDDVGAEILATYESIVDEVPDAIRVDFDAVLADLRGRPVPAVTDQNDDAAVASGPTTTFDAGPPVTDETGATLPVGDPFFDEGYDPEDTPALRLNAYVDFECRDVANNPGPPATQPLNEVGTEP
jgi:hypothetical protein